MPTDDEIKGITLTNTPLDDRDKMAEAAELFRAIGLAVCSWSRLEVQIDMTLIHLNQPKHSIELHDPDHPVGFKSKIKLLKRWFNQHPALKGQTEALRKLAPQLLKLNRERNTFLHSILQTYDPTTQTAVWRGIKPAGPETFNMGLHQGSVGQLIAFAAEAHRLHVEFSKICRQIYETGMLEQLRKSSPHIPHLARLFRRWHACLRS